MVYWEVGRGLHPHLRLTFGSTWPEPPDNGPQPPSTPSGLGDSAHGGCSGMGSGAREPQPTFEYIKQVRVLPHTRQSGMAEQASSSLTKLAGEGEVLVHELGWNAHHSFQSLC